MNNSLTAQALLQARQTGRPVPIPGGQGLYALPNGSVGTPGGGFGGSGNALTNTAQPAVTASPSWWQRWLAPNSGPDLTLNAGTPMATLPTMTVTAHQPVMNQTNPNVTYVSPNTPQAAASAPVTGQTDTPSGPAMAPPGQPMPKQSQPSQSERLAAQAAAYRRATSQGTGLTTDQLNAASLAAAQAGRTYWNPAMNVQPGGNVVNALTTPPVANSMTANYAPTMTPGQVGVGGFVAPQQPWQTANNQWDLSA